MTTKEPKKEEECTEPRVTVHRFKSLFQQALATSFEHDTTYFKNYSPILRPLDGVEQLKVDR